jgi:hypothetical protein
MPPSPIPKHLLSLRLHHQVRPINTSIDLKNTTDDALPNYLHSLKFRQIHTQTDIRLLLGYTAVTIAGLLFYFDWAHGWEASKAYTLPAVVAYFLLNGAFSYWLWFVEGGVVYEGEGGCGKVCLFLPIPIPIIVNLRYDGGTRLMLS